MKINGLHYKIILCVSIIIITGLILGGFYLFHSKLDDAIHKTNYSFMQEAANQQVISFKAKLDGQLDQLSLYARNFENIDMNDYIAVKKALNATEGFGDFKRISIANDIGVVVNNDNTTSSNVLKQDYFISAINGKASISSEILTDDDGEEILIISAPIYKKDKIVGVILGTFNRDTLNQLFSAESFGGMGYSYVFNSEGTIIIKSNATKFVADSDNFFDILRQLDFNGKIGTDTIKEDFNNSVTSIIEYSKDKQERIAVYQPVGTHDWYLFTAVDLKFISSQSSYITYCVMVLVVGISVLFLTLMAIMFIIIRNTKIIMMNNEFLKNRDERYKIANDQMQNIIFEYNFENNMYYATGNIKPMYGIDSDAINIHVTDAIKEKLRQSGFEFFEDMRLCMNNLQSEYEVEFNYLCSDNKYRWFKLKGTFMYDKFNKPFKLIGSITDIQQQKEETEKLRHKAETDQLTGVLNKKSVEEYINLVIKNSNKNSIFAVYVIDLDNFKGVNDNLGHIFGDEVLIDVSCKMRKVFRENDYLGRIGGDEFIAFLNYGEGDYEKALEVIKEKAERLCKSFRETYTGEKFDYKISASIGISVYPKDGLTYLKLYQKADRALYSAKKKGKDNYFVYDEE